ncbi:MAG: hypothetical protein AAF357_03190 [Verrucomicrobiota bacterium]
MKKIIGLAFVTTSILAPSGWSQGEGSFDPRGNSIGIFPGFKKEETVVVGERNPYADRVVASIEVADEESEAARIIRVLESLEIRGVTRNGQGHVRSVLLGDIVLVQGRSLPQLLPDQTDELFVSQVTDTNVEITWRSESGKRVIDGRRHDFEIDGESRVEVILPGQQGTGDEEKLRADIVAGAGVGV